MKDNIIQRLEALRQAMRTRGIDLTIIPHVDPHQSEYMADHWHLREYLSGFNGSAGTLVVSLDDAKLWTDSRYFLQAAQQLDETGITLMKDGLAITPSITDYIRTTLPSGSTVGIDGMLFSINSERDLKEKLGEVGINLVTDFTPADEVWADRPPLPSDKAFIHDMKYAGESTRDKIEKTLARVKEAGADAILISALDEIAWALNLRGKDVAYNPVVTSFLYLGKTGSTLFIDDVKVTDRVREYLAGNDISIAPYNSVLKFAGALPFTTKVLVDPSSSSSSLVTALGKRISLGRSPIPLLKGIRNDVQIEGLQRAMHRDGIALVRSFMEIEETLSQGKRLTETGVCKILTRNRSLQPDYFDDSFGTIAGYKGHGAIVHYEPTEESDAEIYPDGLLLVDSRSAIPRRNDRHNPHRIARQPHDRRASRLHSRAERLYRTCLSRISRRDMWRTARHSRPSISVERRENLSARHRSWCGLVPERTRRASEFPKPHRPPYDSSVCARHGDIRRARTVCHRQIRNTLREHDTYGS